MLAGQKAQLIHKVGSVGSWEILGSGESECMGGQGGSAHGHVRNVTGPEGLGGVRIDSQLWFWKLDVSRRLPAGHLLCPMPIGLIARPV